MLRVVLAVVYHERPFDEVDVLGAEVEQFSCSAARCQATVSRVALRAPTHAAGHAPMTGLASQCNAGAPADKASRLRQRTRRRLSSRRSPFAIAGVVGVRPASVTPIGGIRIGLAGVSPCLRDVRGAQVAVAAARESTTLQRQNYARRSVEVPSSRWRCTLMLVGKYAPERRGTSASPAR
jgi:hypothetical protein